MLKPSVAFLLFASVAIWSNAHGIDQSAPTLKQSQLYEPEVVATWLKENAGREDRARAAAFFEVAIKVKAQRRWGPAVKSFGASALYYPTPRAIAEYAEAKLLARGEDRKREGTLRANAANDLRYAELLHRSVLAADSVLHTMTAAELQKARESADCLATYLQDQRELATCRPLQLYGLIPAKP